MVADDNSSELSRRTKKGETNVDGEKEKQNQLILRDKKAKINAEKSKTNF